MNRLITRLEMVSSTELSRSGIVSIWPCRNSTFRAPARGVGPGQVQHLHGHVQAVHFAFRADPAAGQQHVDTAPEPRSSTVSPGRRSATATGLPQPRLALTAALSRP